MNRDRSLDLGKGLAILFVYLGHSILYHPIDMTDIPWCHSLERFIVSFNMPMFFIISGYLFSKTRKDNIRELYIGKTKRIFFPYLTTMTVIICTKLVLPTELSYNQAAMGGVNSMIINALFYGGDRWFVYTLYIIFLLLIPIRKLLKHIWVNRGIIIVLTMVLIFYLDQLPTFFAIQNVFHYMLFFIAGFALNEHYPFIKQMALRYWGAVYTMFIILNITFIETFCKVPMLFRLVLPFTGTLALMTMANQLEKVIEKSKVVQYIEYCGKYSLQFYLFTFCYPLIRWGIVNVLNVTDPVLILTAVFFFQLIAITPIIEVTRRIKFLKIPCGY